MDSNLISTAEKLLEDIKKLDVANESENKQLRSNVLQAATAIIRDAADPIEYMKYQWVKVSNSHLSL